MEENGTHTSTTASASTMIDYRVMPDLDRTVPKFSGHETSATAEDWISTVVGLANLNFWPFQYWLQYVRCNLTGAARSWYLSEVFPNWNTVLVQFRAAFVRTLRMSDQWQELSSRLQKPDEHIIDYFYDKLRLCKALSLPFNEVRDHIILGMRSEEMSNYAMNRTHINSSELLADI